MNNQTMKNTLAALAIALLGGCASGPLYPEAKQAGATRPPAGKGMALIYMKGAATGGAAKFNLFANDRLLRPKMQQAAFYTYVAEPGPLRLATGSDNTTRDVMVGTLISGPLVGLAGLADQKRDQVVLNVVPGQTYFCEMKRGVFRGAYVAQVTPEEGEKEMQKCHWINSPKQ